jgi:Planctomycete cytochrome C
MLAGCSDLDPNTGAPRPEEEADATMAQDVYIAPGEVSFGRDIRPLMNRPGKGDPTGRGCKSCHYSTEPSHNGRDLSGLELSTLGHLRQGGGSSGSRIVVAGKPNESIIVQALLGQYGFANRMPKNGSPYWSDEEIQLVIDWISQGAKGADDE